MNSPSMFLHRVKQPGHIVDIHRVIPLVYTVVVSGDYWRQQTRVAAFAATVWAGQVRRIPRGFHLLAASERVSE